jgi:hypothetical protein
MNAKGKNTKEYVRHDALWKDAIEEFFKDFLKFFDTELNFKYRTYKILEQDEEILKGSDNPFAFVVLTALYSLKTKGSIDLKYASKVSLYKLLKSKELSKESINKLFIFMDNILSLPTSLKNRFKIEVENIEKESEVAVMGLSLRDSETGQLWAKDRDIHTATKMFRAGEEIRKILEYTELTEEEFQREVIEKINAETNKNTH